MFSRVVPVVDSSGSPAGTPRSGPPGTPRSAALETPRSVALSTPRKDALGIAWGSNLALGGDDLSSAASARRVVGALADTRWYARLRSGNLRGLRREEAVELFEEVSPGGNGFVSLAALRDKVSKADLTDAEKQGFEQAFNCVVAVSDRERVHVEAFLQAMRLGSVAEADRLALSLRGMEPKSDVIRIRRSQLEEYLRRRTDVRTNLLSLPFSIAWFVTFFILVFCHVRHDLVYRLTEAVARDVAPLATTDGSNYPNILWSWLDSRIEQASIARYGQVIGGVQVSRTVREPDIYKLDTLCSYSEPKFISTLFGARGSSSVHRGGSPEICRDVNLDYQDDVWILPALSRADATANTTQVSNWWTMSSSSVPIAGPERVEVSLLSYNGKLKFYVFYRLALELRKSGALDVTEKVVAFDEQPAWMKLSKDNKKVGKGDHILLMMLDVLFLIMYTCLGLLQIGDCVKRRRECATLVRTRRIRNCRRDGIFWRVIDWLNILMGVVVTVMYCYRNNLTQGLIRLIQPLPQVAVGGTYTRAQFSQLLVDSGLTWNWYTRQMAAMREQALLLTKCLDDIRWYVAALATVACVRLFKAFRANPLVSMMLQTSKKALVDLSHYLVIFSIVFLSFVFIGHVIFGTGVENFSTVGKATHSTFLVLMGFIFDDYRVQMFDTAGALGTVWAVAFTIVVMVILLNMILAIIFSVYTDVKIAVGEPTSVFDQAMEAFTRKSVQVELMHRKATAAQRGASQSLQREELELALKNWNEEKILGLLLALPQAHEDDVVSLEDLCKAFGIQLPAERIRLELLLEQVSAKESSNLPNISLTDSVRLCGRIDSNVQDLDAFVTGLTEQVLEGGKRRWEAWQDVARSSQPHDADVKLMEELVIFDGQAPAAERASAEAQVANAEDTGLKKAAAAKEDTESEKELSTAPVQVIDEGIEATDADPRLPLPFLESEEPSSRAIVQATTEISPPTATQEPLIEPPIQALEATIEDRLARAAKSQEERHAALEQAVARLAARLSPLQQVGTAEARAEPDRLALLEAKVKRLAAKIEPVLDELRTMIAPAEGQAGAGSQPGMARNAFSSAL